MFVARYTSGGSLQWARHVPGLGLGGGAAIALDGSGGIHVAGAFVASITFGQGELAETVLSVDPGGSTNPFVAKSNSDGSFAWARSATGAIAAVAFGVAAHPTGTSITGYFFDFGTASLTFGAGEPTATTLTTTFGQEIFVARYNERIRAGQPTSDCQRRRRPDGRRRRDRHARRQRIERPGPRSVDVPVDDDRQAAEQQCRSPEPDSPNPTFVADVPGTYQVQLVVSDGAGDERADTVIIRTENRRPVANAGADQTGDHRVDHSAERQRIERSRRRRADIRMVVRPDAAAKRRRAERSDQRLPIVHRGCAGCIRRAADCQRRAARQRRRHVTITVSPPDPSVLALRLAGVGHDYRAWRSRLVFVHRSGRADHFAGARQHGRVRHLGPAAAASC